MRDYKNDVKVLLGFIGRLPVVRPVLRHPEVRRRLQSVRGADFFYVGYSRTHPFDMVHGTSTSGCEIASDFAADESETAHFNAYLGSQPQVIRMALGLLPPLQSFTFVDLGCGKGRPLFVASEFAFRHVIGVEFSPQLAETARSNAAIIAQRYPQRPPVQVVTADAGSFALPPGNLVIFLYHPFGQDVMSRVVTQIERALAAEARSVYVVYYNPVLGRCFDGSVHFRRHFSGMLSYAPEERGFGLDQQEDAVVIWQAGTAPASTLPADKKISVGPDEMWVALVE
ncbi:MAG: hypothetical protein JWQ72_241 [Polaromonas sp.]|nr:hypothetical protein [Polaromonas sp.]